MFALIYSDAQGAKEILETCEGVVDVRLIAKMSELNQLVASGDLEGIWIDERLGLTDQIHSKVATPVYEIPDGFFLLSDTLAWYEGLRKTAIKEEPPIEPQPETVTQQPEPPVVQQDYEPPRVTTLPRFAQSSQEFERGGKKNRRTPVFMLTSPKGGSGRTTIGSYMAYYGAMQGKKVAVIDLDTQGNIAAVLGKLEAVDGRGWRGNSVEQAVRDGTCLVHESGMYLFPSPQSKEVVLQSADDALHLLTVCLEEVDVIFLDMPQGYTPLHQVLLPYVTRLITVVTPSPDKLDRVQEFAEKLENAGLSTDEVTFVINKSQHERSDLRAMSQYILPYVPKLTVPYDNVLARKGGLSGKKLMKACTPWWDEAFSLRKNIVKKKWGLFRK